MLGTALRTLHILNHLILTILEVITISLFAGRRLNNLSKVTLLVSRGKMGFKPKLSDEEPSLEPLNHLLASIPALSPLCLLIPDDCMFTVTS